MPRLIGMTGPAPIAIEYAALLGVTEKLMSGRPLIQKMAFVGACSYAYEGYVLPAYGK
jgi:hypothetical protein